MLQLAPSPPPSTRSRDTPGSHHSCSYSGEHGRVNKRPEVMSRDTIRRNVRSSGTPDEPGLGSPERNRGGRPCNPGNPGTTTAGTRVSGETRFFFTGELGVRSSLGAQKQRPYPRILSGSLAAPDWPGSLTTWMRRRKQTMCEEWKQMASRAAAAEAPPRPRLLAAALPNPNFHF